MFNSSKPTASDVTGADRDEALVARSRQGDLEGFGLLVQRYDSRVSSLIARLIGSSGTTEDVDSLVQAVFVQVYHALPKLGQDTEFSLRLSRIAADQALKHRSATRRQAQAISEEELPLTVRDALTGLLPGPADAAAQRVRDKDLRLAIEGLPEKQRTVVLLHYFEGYSCEEAAEILDCSTDTVWSQLSDACRSLRRSATWLGE